MLWHIFQDLASVNAMFKTAEIGGALAELGHETRLFLRDNLHWRRRDTCIIVAR